MKKRVVNTYSFWEAMCHPAFFRVDLYSGAIGATYYLCSRPPETVEGFIEDQMLGIITDLGLDRPSPIEFIKQLFKWRK